ncbi:MAG: endolytic transglycosylase MltG [Pseudomonadota bacterium]
MRGSWSNLFTVAIVLVVAGVIGLKSLDSTFGNPGPLAEDTTFVVPSGAGLGRITDALLEEGVIDSGWMFTLAARRAGVAQSMKAGEYLIPAGASIEEVMALISEGRAVQHRVTVAEGLTSRQVVEIVRASDVLTGEIANVPPEGALAPDTYFVQRGETRQAVIDRMLVSQERILAEAWAARAPDLPYDTPVEALILASIVEKETGVGGERPEVAGVFVNRLRRGMRLQSDPTIIYGISGGEPLVDAEGKRRGIRRSEIRKETPYNTYTIDGLPPTPIANPGVSAIEAVMNPAATEYLFFVASCDFDGSHGFSKTLREHEAKVREWRRCENQRPADGG